MNDSNIGIFLVLATLVVILVVALACWAFSSFLAREKARGERFRDMNLKPPDER